MLTLITDQQAFERFVGSVDWHDGTVLESHFVSTRGRAPAGSTLRILVAASGERYAPVEVVFYEPEHANGLYSQTEIDTIPAAVVQRRKIEFSVGSHMRIHAACMAYRLLGDELTDPGSYFARVPAYDDKLLLSAPYDIDWRTAMDLAGTPQGD